MKLSKGFYSLIFLIITSSVSYSQYNLEWTSPTYNLSEVEVGWTIILSLNNYSGTYKYRFYEKDQDKIEYMHEGGYNMTPEFTYYFTQAEKDADRWIYSTNYDLTGDGFPEFYVNRKYGTTNMRYGFKILNLLNNQTIIEFDNASFSLDYYGFMDADADGILELIVRRLNFPYDQTQTYLSYDTGVSTGGIESVQSPKEFILEQNFPNPFNSQTIINYSLSEQSNVELTIYDISGSVVKKVLNQFQSAGEYSTYWDGKNENGRKVSSGAYFYELKTDGTQNAKKMIMIK